MPNTCHRSVREDMHRGGVPGQYLHGHAEAPLSQSTAHSARAQHRCYCLANERLIIAIAALGSGGVTVTTALSNQPPPTAPSLGRRWRLSRGIASPVISRSIGTLRWSGPSTPGPRHPGTGRATSPILLHFAPQLSQAPRSSAADVSSGSPSEDGVLE